MSPLDDMKRKMEADRRASADLLGIWLKSEPVFPIVGRIVRRPVIKLIRVATTLDEAEQLNKISAREQLNALVSLEEFR